MFHVLLGRVGAGCAALALVLLSVLTVAAQAPLPGASQSLAEPYRVLLPMVTKPEPPPPPPPAGLVNGNFEVGAAGWEQYSARGYTIILSSSSLPVTPHSGVWAAWLGGAFDESSLLSQVFNMPAGATRLSYYLWIASGDICDPDYDVGGLFMDDNGDITEDDVLDAYILCDGTSTGGWIRREVDIARYAGKQVELAFVAFTDEVINSNMFVDDVSLNTAPLQPAMDASAEPLFIIPTRQAPSLLSPQPRPPAMDNLAQLLRTAVAE
jgi:hypothetical protein